MFSSFHNVKGASIIQGKLDNLPEPITVYPTNDTHIDSSNLKLFLIILKKICKYDKYYLYVDKRRNNTKIIKK